MESNPAQNPTSTILGNLQYDDNQLIEKSLREAEQPQPVGDMSANQPQPLNPGTAPMLTPQPAMEAPPPMQNLPQPAATQQMMHPSQMQAMVRPPPAQMAMPANQVGIPAYPPPQAAIPQISQQTIKDLPKYGAAPSPSPKEPSKFSLEFIKKHVSIQKIAILFIICFIFQIDSLRDLVFKHEKLAEYPIAASAALACANAILYFIIQAAMS